MSYVANPKTKICCHCKEAKPISEFYRCKSRKDGLHVQCKMCMKKYNTTEAAHLNKKKYRKNHPDMVRRQTLKDKTGITLELYNYIYQQQKGVCAICGQPETKMWKGTHCSLSVDHDHKTGKIRGLLCNRCNLLLGHVFENDMILESAIKYLQKNRIISG